jgi:hypothetical protein
MRLDAVMGLLWEPGLSDQKTADLSSTVSGVRENYAPSEVPAVGQIARRLSGRSPD